jgi:hypothetical protein
MLNGIDDKIEPLSPRVIVLHFASGMELSDEGGINDSSGPFNIITRTQANKSPAK